MQVLEYAKLETQEDDNNLNKVEVGNNFNGVVVGKTVKELYFWSRVTSWSKGLV